MADMGSIMKLFQGQQGGKPAAPASPLAEESDVVSAGDDSSPMSSGMATPTKKDGLKASGRIQVHLALNVLGKALASFEDSDGEEAKTILSAMNRLVDKFGDTREKELVPAQILELVKSEPSLSGVMDQKPQPPQGA